MASLAPSPSSPTPSAQTMDYHAVHGHDLSSFDAPGTHRLPTVAASQALDDLEHELALPLSTGLDSLDRALVGADAGRRGGIERGQVTEIWGPPGTGKTALAIQTAAHAVCDGHDVVWVDCLQTLPRRRIVRVVEAVKAAQDAHVSGHDGAGIIDWAKFTHFSCLTLPHLMALTSRPAPSLIGQAVSLVVVSCPSALLNEALPRSQDGAASSKAGQGLSAAAKRSQGLHFVMDALQKLAATRNCAVLVLTQCATRMQSEVGATLVAAVNASVWEQGVTTRLVLFRDWAWTGTESGSVFVAGLQKVDGKRTNGVVEGVSAFSVEPGGVASVDYDADAAGSLSGGPADLGRRKRKLGQTELEVPDSEDEGDEGEDDDYGWAGEDEEALPAPPPQWQGSEDILLGQEVGRGGGGGGGGGDGDGEGSGDEGASDSDGGSRDGATSDEGRLEAGEAPR
ncbi:hypothetical protein CDD83_8842 [Cordyceps sp. RAO-2017]|nr:hypothetical protein CDD83_8842 [Cordyceps sp. RAO-2017]